MHEFAAVGPAKNFASRSPEHTEIWIAAAMIIAKRDLMISGRERDDCRTQLSILGSGIVDDALAVQQNGNIPCGIDLEFIDAGG